MSKNICRMRVNCFACCVSLHTFLKSADFVNVFNSLKWVFFEEKGLFFFITDSRISVCFRLGPNKHGLVTYIQVSVYIGNTLSWLNGG